MASSCWHQPSEQHSLHRDSTLSGFFILLPSVMPSRQSSRSGGDRARAIRVQCCQYAWDTMCAWKIPGLCKYIHGRSLPLSG